MLFTDESKFEIFGMKKQLKIWQTENFELKPQNLISIVKHGT